MYLRDGSAQTSIRAVTLKQKLQIKLFVSPSRTVLTPANQSQHLPYNQAPGRVATGVPLFKLLVLLDPAKFLRKRESNPRSSALEADPPRRVSAVGKTVFCGLI